MLLMSRITQILESRMVICFGILWLVNIVKSIKLKTAKGKSLVFLCFILLGYVDWRQIC
jgi:hypothetical protein